MRFTSLSSTMSTCKFLGGVMVEPAEVPCDFHEPLREDEELVGNNMDEDSPAAMEEKRRLSCVATTRGF